MTTISAQSLTWSRGTNVIIENISFSLEEGDKMGVIGVNGSGKSTLLRLITGELEADSGSVYISKDKTVGILTQEGAFEASQDCGGTVLEQMYTAFGELIETEKKLEELEAKLSDRDDPHQVSRAAEFTELYTRFVDAGGLEFRSRCASILSKMGFGEAEQSQHIDSLSGGQRTRLALARQLCREPDILILDEPTNHLDIETLTWLENFLVSYKKNVIVVSHDRYFLDRITNKTLYIGNRRGKLYNGGYTQSMEQRKKDREIEERHYKNQQREIARQEAYIEQQRAWNRERNIIAAESRQKALDRMVKLDKPENDPRSIRMSFSHSGESGNDVIWVKDLSMAYGEKKLFDRISFMVKKKERVFIVGANGCGKSTLIKILLGRIGATGGFVETGYNVEIGYYDQENQNLNSENTVLDELWNAYPTMKETEIRNALALFRFTGEDVFKTVGVLSGGERARLTLCKLILSHMNLLILDEPTNHLDINSREVLEEALERFDGTVITVSHDRYFIDKLATRILEIAPGKELSDTGDLLDYRISHAGEGGYDEYREFRQKRIDAYNAAHPQNTEKPQTDEKTSYIEKKRSQADIRREQKRMEKLRLEAKRLEAELESIDSELYGDAASDYVRAAELDVRKNEIEERLLEIYEETET